TVWGYDFLSAHEPLFGWPHTPLATVKRIHDAVATKIWLGRRCDSFNFGYPRVGGRGCLGGLRPFLGFSILNGGGEPSSFDFCTPLFHNSSRRFRRLFFVACPIPILSSAAGSDRAHRRACAVRRSRRAESRPLRGGPRSRA